MPSINTPEPTARDADGAIIGGNRPDDGSYVAQAMMAHICRGLHVFPVDHPGQSKCIGKHGPENPCDGIRGKHPAVKWGTWAIAETPQMIQLALDKHEGLANIGIACGPSNLVVLDEDAPGELARWCADHGITLPDTYEVSTGRGRHLYFRHDHAVQRISNSDKALAGYKIDVRGDGGFVVGHGSVHESGAAYVGNDAPIADLPNEVDDLLLAGAVSGNGVAVATTTAEFFKDTPAHDDPNTTMIGDGHRHNELVTYAGRLRGKDLDYFEAEAAYEKRWLLCEQPDGQIPEARFHSAACRYPVTWQEAQTKLRDVYSRYPAGDRAEDTDEPGESTSWEPIDLGPYLRGEVEPPQPRVGVRRSDGLQLIYPGCDHAILGETESGKTWLALACVAAELALGHHVVYIHYEESTPASTIERLNLLEPHLPIASRLRFVAPATPIRDVGWLDPLLDPAPTLVVHDGVNEAMSLHGVDIMAADGASAFRRRLVTPFKKVGAATLACDHLPKDRDGHNRSRDAYGSVHKGNALDGARIVLENKNPFGRNMRGVSYVFVTKDRPGQLRCQGQPTNLPGKTFIATLVVDDMTAGADFTLALYAPKENDQPTNHDTELANVVHTAIGEQPDHTVGSLRTLLALVRKAGHKYRDTEVRNAVDDLIVNGLLIEVSGKRGAKGYRVVLTASQDSTAPEDSPS